MYVFSFESQFPKWGRFHLKLGQLVARVVFPLMNMQFVSLDIDEEVVSQTTPIRAHKGLLKELAEAVVIMTPLQSVVAITLTGSPERWIKAG